MTRVKECVLYRGFEHGDILDKMTALMDASERSAVNASEMEEEFYECVNGLIEIAGSYGFTGNLWHDYLTLLLVNHENAFSMASEIRGAIEGSINVLHASVNSSHVNPSSGTSIPHLSNISTL